MSKETFEAACEIAMNSGSNICLGGGEPTLHPEFWEFMGLAMKYDAWGDSELRILVITNGSLTQDALALAGMARKGLIYADLSQDEWHDPIDTRVVEAFQRLRKQGGSGGIRSVTSITNHGSAKKNKLSTDTSMCCCEDWLVMPNGKIYGCGCRRYSFGTVHDYTIPEDFQIGEDCVVKWKQGQGALQGLQGQAAI